MTLFRDLIGQLSLRGGVLEPVVFSPLPYSSRAKACVASGADAGTKPWAGSVGVNNFWQSSRCNKALTLADVEEGSPWDLVLKDAFAA